MKRVLVCLLGAILLVLTGCGGPGDGEMTELWVVTEESKSDGMNYQARMTVKVFEEAHPGITVKLEILPADGEGRETYLQQLRSQIMAGEGPDVYLLPTGSTITTGTAKSVKEYTVEPLFPDVRQAMASGLFWDISGYYDADTELNTAALHPDIMAAGCLGEARYVLPLRFDRKLLLADGENWAASGLDAALLDGDLDTLAWELVNADATGMGAYGLQLPDDLSALPRIFDYEKGELLVTREEIADYMRLYQSWKAKSLQQAAVIDKEIEAFMYSEVDERFWNFYTFPVNDITALQRIPNFETFGIYWAKFGFPVFTERMEYLTDALLMGKRLRENVTLRPLRDTAGQTHAQVTYFGAVGSGCPRPGLAYEFLREFLAEGCQWDIERPRVKKTPETFDVEQEEIQCYVTVEESWPVRTTGSGAYLWANRQYQLFHGSGMNRRVLGTAASNVLSDADFGIVAEPIDVVEFPFVQAEEETFSYALAQLNDESGQPTDVDIEALARQVYEDLWWHLAEG